MLALLLPAAPAQAQGVNFKSFVSSTGGGSVCTFAAPCSHFQEAHDATFAGGMISCLDGGHFAGANITRSITIDCTGTSASVTPFTISGAGVFVRIRNLTVFGIDFGNAAALFVENCTIRNVNSGVGIRFQPTGLGAQLVVSDTIIASNGTGGNGAGIYVAPQSGGSAGVVLNRVTFELNTTAMLLDSFSGGIGTVMVDSIVSSSFQNGIIVNSGSVNHLNIRNSKLLNNVGNAIQSAGAGSLVLLDDTTVTGNQTGVSIVAGGAMQSYRNNRIFANNSDGPAIPAVPGVSGPMF